MRLPLSFSLLVCVCVALAGPISAQSSQNVQVWLTNRDRTQLLTPQGTSPVFSEVTGQENVITVDDRKTYQPVDGFGFALTGGSAQLLHKMDPAPRHALLEELFGRGQGDLGLSYMRVSIGSSDMNDHVFTYDDVPVGETDPGLKRFSLREDEVDLIPVLKEILAISPKLQILASPWSAPSWMKDNEAPKGGKLRPQLYPVYAAYLVRYLQGMAAHGVPVVAITMQNEPLNPKNTPSMVMEAPEEQTFLRDAFGPALHKAGLGTKVVLFDHNCNHPDYPLTILNDPKARAFADGSGFHLYEGEISALTQVHDAYPAKNLYFTEQMVVEHNREGAPTPIAYPVSRIVIGAMRNWSRNVLLWNLAADPSFGPHTSDGGCPMCQGAITLDGNTVSRNIALYTIAHASKFVPPGSVRIDSTEPDPELANVAWRTPEGKHVLLVTNTGHSDKTVKVGWSGRQFSAQLDADSVATFVW